MCMTSHDVFRGARRVAASSQRLRVLAVALAARFFFAAGGHATYMHHT